MMQGLRDVGRQASAAVARNGVLASAALTLAGVIVKVINWRVAA